MNISTTPVDELRNIGTTVARRLASIGINSREELAKVGSVKAYRLLRSQQPGKTLPLCYYLYSLEAALRDIRWDDLTHEEKKQLRDQADSV